MKTKVIIFVLAVLPALSFATNPKSSFPLDATAVESEISEDYILEDWMLDLDTWTEASAQSNVNSLESDSWMTVVQENEMELEPWMLDINENTWEVTESEQELEVEDWMNNPSTWLESK